MVRLVRTDGRMVRQRYSVTLQERTSTEEPKTKITLKTIRKGFEN